MQIYSELEVLQGISNILPEWAYDRENILREYKFHSYLQSIEFVSQSAILAEEMDHHPLILISWGRVLIKIHTHSAKAISSLDFELASQIDKLYISFESCQKIAC